MLIFFLISSFILVAQDKEIIWGDVVNCSELNSSSNEFAPSWNRFENQLYFNSDRSGSSKFYIAQYGESLILSGLLEAEINEGSTNRSYITFLNRDEAYITSYISNKGFPLANIFTTKIHKNQWSREFVVDEINTNDFNSQPSISQNADLLVMVSNRGNETNDTDIWMAYKRDDGLWSRLDPCNILNSPGNEITPYLKSSDTLFFSSDGLGGLGGFDIYMSVRENGSWQRPKNIVELNTEFDDSDLSFIGDHTAIFASNRPGGFGNLDLYSCAINLTSKDRLIYSKPELSFSANRDIVKIDHVYEVEEKPVSEKVLDLVETDIVGNHINTAIRSINFKSDNLILSIDARPRELIKEWICYLTFGDLTTVAISEGSDLPSQLDIDLGEFKNKILLSNELNFELLAKDTKNQSYIENIAVALNKSEVKKQAVLDQYGKKFFYKYIFIDNANKVESVVQGLNGQLKYSKNIVIQYFSKESETAANDIYKAIVNIADKSASINIQLSEDTLDVKNEDLKYYFRILF